LQALASTSPAWQRTTAGRMAKTSGGGYRIPVWFPRAAAVILAVGAGWPVYQHLVPPDPAKLIARAYTEQRPFDLRIPGADHAPVRIQRRGSGSTFQRPAALVAAQTRIARELSATPDSPEWLALRARVEILTSDPDSAIATLNRALEKSPEDPALLADLGVAFSMRAEAADRASDHVLAIEHLTRSLRARPDAPEVVFNRAVVYERMSRSEEAAREWRHYLRLDPSGGWSGEAGKRLAELEQKQKSAP